VDTDDQPDGVSQPTPTETIGARIARFRTDRGLTPTQLALEAQISKSYLSALESGDEAHRRPSGDTLYRIATALGVAIADLLGHAITSAADEPWPDGLLEFARRDGLPQADLEMLASIHFRGDKPKTPERWQFIYQAIKMSGPLDRS
jgi:transcriptional regulator with XRE-family HTH domain